MPIIETVDQLEAVVGKKPAALDMKVVDHIDPHAQRWLAHSAFMMATLGLSDGPIMVMAGGEPGFTAATANTLAVPLHSVDQPDLLEPGAPFGSLWLVPGMNESLRINGTLADITEGAVHIGVEECYLHCAKAFLRSDFWAANPCGEAPSRPEDFAKAVQWLALGTLDTNGRADVSPKGDPAGKMVRFDGQRLLFADRPGNRRTDSFRNILVQPRVAAQLLLPGSPDALRIRGVAELTDDRATRSLFEVQGKAPTLAIAVSVDDWSIETSPALARADLWPSAPPPNDLEPAKIFAAHMRLSKEKSLSAKVAKALVSVPGVMRRGLESDYEKNLY